MLTLLFGLFTLLQVTILFIISIIVLAVTYPFDKSRYWVHVCSRCICWLLYDFPPTIRRTIDGVENIEKGKAYVITMNHNSGFDIFAAYKIPLNFRWVSKREVFRIPFMGPLLTIHGDIPIERGSASVAMAKVIRDGKLWLSRGASVAIFPEGTRSKTGEINRFKNGAFNLAKEAGVEILPIVMTGTNEFFRKGSFWVNWRNRVGIRVLKPISVDEIASMESKDLSVMVHDRMADALAELRSDIAAEKK